MSDELKSYKDLTIGAIITEAGNSHNYNTGTWRTFRPVHKMENCIHCLFCWMYCPDSAVIVEDEKFSHYDYDHCKGCGICEHECPSKEKAIVMESEDNYR
ncbi:4Fe-4S dicluster-binding protein [Thermodesulfobacteriota bacterium]